MYFEEVEFYAKRIRKNNASERLTELAIVHNPKAKNPNKLIQTFRKQMDEIDGKAYLHKERMTKSDEHKFKEIARLMKANAEKRKG